MDPDATYAAAMARLSADPEGARALMREAAGSGHLDAQFELSMMMRFGVGGPVDETEADMWQLRAAEAGHSGACLNLGARDKDPAKIVEWYELAADGGSAEAAARLSMMYQLGDGVPVDPVRARLWFSLANELGYAWDGPVPLKSKY